jgi:predicted nucleic acid-binding protein
LVVDSSPLIYLARLEALDVFTIQDPAHITPGVRREVLVPQAAVRFPEMARIEPAIGEGQLVLTALRQEEQAAADDIGSRIPGLGAGERESLALAPTRGFAVVLHDRRASRIGRAMGIDVVGPLELLFGRTDEDGVLEGRVRAFARLVDMRIEALEHLLERVKERSRW